MEEYPTYLVHFNKNHSSKNGQFTFGDGDGDNIRDDHHHYSENKGDLADSPKAVTGKTVKTVAKLLAIPGKWLAGKAFAKTQLGQFVGNSKTLLNYGKKNLGWNKIMKGSNWENYKAEQKAKIRDATDPLYDKAANFINKFI